MVKYFSKCAKVYEWMWLTWETPHDRTIIYTHTNTISSCPVCVSLWLCAFLYNIWRPQSKSATRTNRNPNGVEATPSVRWFCTSTLVFSLLSASHYWVWLKYGKDIGRVEFVISTRNWVKVWISRNIFMLTNNQVMVLCVPLS